MKKIDFVKLVAEKMDITQKDANECIDCVFSVIGDALVDGDTVTIPNFGRFGTNDVSERVCRNPQTGGSVISPAHRKVRFNAAVALKEAVR